MKRICIAIAGLLLTSPAFAQGSNNPSTTLPSLNVIGSANLGVFTNCGTETVDYIEVYAYGKNAAITCQSDGRAISPVPTVAGTFAARTKNWAGSPDVNIGIIAWGFSDMPTGSGTPGVWTYYGETRKYPGTTGLSVTNEFDITNFVAGLGKIDPYIAWGATNQLSANLWLPSGGGCAGATVCYNPLTGLTNLTAGTAQLAIGIENNSGDYLEGIEFSYNALHGVDGKSTGTFAPAMLMAMGQTLEWVSCNNVSGYPANCAANNVTARIATQQDTTALLEQMIFYDNTLLFQTSTQAELSIVFNNSDTEGLQVAGDSAGNTPTLSATGTPAAINLGLSPKGAGVIAVLGTGLNVAGTSTLTGDVSTAAHYLDTSAVPVISSCGSTTNGTVLAGSSNASGQFTMGTASPTACTVTFAVAYPNNAFCTVTPAGGTAYSGTYRISAQSKSAFTLTLGTGTSSLVWQYTCGGN